MEVWWNTYFHIWNQQIETTILKSMSKVPGVSITPPLITDHATGKHVNVIGEGKVYVAPLTPQAVTVWWKQGHQEDITQW